MGEGMRGGDQEGGNEGDVKSINNEKPRILFLISKTLNALACTVSSNARKF